ncbi:DUF4913 domain-containing protein [Rhodococcus hoagii]|nr:DUF4913 domain-containing protein [Prescottella equi]
MWRSTERSARSRVADCVWDAHWWRHSEVVARLTALWWAFEDARAARCDRAAMSGWWVDHCEPHLKVLLDGESGR